MDQDVPADATPGDPLRILTCGGSGEGKSTLAEALSNAGNRAGAGQALALRADGDISFHHSATAKKNFSVADTHDHEHYIRELASGPSACDFAIVLADARKGITAQTRHHCCLMDLIGIRKITLAVNKMDLAEYSQERFEEIAAEFKKFAEKF